MGLNDFEVFLRIGVALTSPRPILSWLELARRARVPDDKTKRAVERLEAHFGRSLVVVGDDHRLSLSGAGHILFRLDQQMASLADGAEQPAEPLTIEADADAAAVLLPHVLPNFWNMWGSVVQLRVFPLDSGVRKHVAEGMTALGLGLAEAGETIPAAEILGPELPWVLLVPASHALSDSQEAISAEQLGVEDHLFISSVAAGSVGLERFLSGVPRNSLVECESVWAMVRAGLGLGLMPDLFGNQSCEGFRKVAVKDAGRTQLRLFLPRSGAGSLSEPAQGLEEAIRRVALTRFSTEPESSPSPLPSGNGEVAAIPVASLAEVTT